MVGEHTDHEEAEKRFSLTSRAYDAFAKGGIS